MKRGREVKKGVFPALSMNKDVTVISYSNPPGCSGRLPARSSSLRAAATPYSGSGCETQELRMWKHRILAPDSGDVYEGMISVSSDSRIFPNIEKCLLFCCLGPKWYLTLCDPMNCSPPGFSVHGIFQAITLEQFAISFSRGSSWPQDLTPFSCTTCIGRKILYH